MTTLESSVFISNMRDRIDALIGLLDMSPTQFAQTVGIQRSTLQHILNGRNEPSLNVVKSIHAALPDVDLDWLLTGNGKPLKSEPAKGPVDDYPLFRDAENPEFPTEIRNNPVFSNHEPVEKPSKQRKKADNKSVSKDNQDVSQVQQMRVKEILVFYEDGTYQKFSSISLKN